MKKILIIIMLGMFLISFTSAFEFDNVKNIKEIGKANYPNIEIKNLFGLGRTLWTGELTKNTAKCGNDCSAEKTIILPEKGSLIDEIKFETILKDGMRIEQPIRNYQFYVKSEKEEIEINDYERQCEETILENNTIIKRNCQYMKIGSHKELITSWIPYEIGKEMEAGTYELKLEGEKKPSRTVDWIIKTNGKWINEWAVWGKVFSTIEAHGIPQFGGSTTDTLSRGIWINMTETINLNAVEKLSTVDATRLIVRFWNGTIINTASFTGDIATLSTPIILHVSEEAYRIEVDKSGASYSFHYAISGFPVVNDYFNWSSESRNGGGAYSPNPNCIVALNISGQDGQIDLNTPINASTENNLDIKFNATAILTGGATLVNRTLYIWWVNGTLLGINATIGLSGTLDSANDTINIYDGIYLWNKQYCDSDGDCGFSSLNNTLIIDTTPPIITLESPVGLVNFNEVGGDETLNVTFTDLNLSSCWYNYNGTNITIDGCVSGVKNSTNFILELGNTNMTLYANDSGGNENNTFIEWDYKVLELNQTFNSETTEGGLETFLGNIKLGSGFSITETLFNYNGSTSAGQSFVSGENITLRKTDFIIPNINTQTNVSFNWIITLSDSTQINLSTKNQTLNNLILDNCSTFTIELLNFTGVDEETQILLPNMTIEVAVDIYDRDRTSVILNLSNTYEKVNPLRICINRNISTGIFYSLDVIVRYEDIGNANEYYNIVNRSITNGTKSAKITLFDLNLSDSTEFQLTFIGSDFLPIENALVSIDRQYISENIFKTVELPKTDFNGQTILHLVRNDVIYNIRIIKEGKVLGNFENLVAFCEDFTIGDCVIDLNAFDSVESIFNFDEELGIIYSVPFFNGTTNKITFNFVTTDGTSKTVKLEVTRNDIFGNRSICNSTLVSSGGTLTCDIDPNIDETTLNIKIFVDGVETVKGSVDLDSSNYGVAGYLIMFVMAISFILLFSGSKTGVLVSIGLILASSIGLGLVSGNMLGVGAVGIWLLIIIFIAIYKLNKERIT